jgi:hypothetical protein
MKQPGVSARFPHASLNYHVRKGVSACGGNKHEFDWLVHGGELVNGWGGGRGYL